MAIAAWLPSLILHVCSLCFPPCLLWWLARSSRFAYSSLLPRRALPTIVGTAPVVVRDRVDDTQCAHAASRRQQLGAREQPWCVVK